MSCDVVSCASSGLMGPVVKMFAPYDTYRIWKRGNWLRLDSTIDGIHPNNLKVQRAHISLIFQGTSSADCTTTAGDGELYVLNRNEQTYERYNACIVSLRTVNAYI
jgi:hypothetical protein